MAKKRRKTEAQLDLENIRKLKRLTKRVYAGLEAMERWIIKMERGSSKYQNRPTPEEMEATLQAYDLDEFSRGPGDGPTQKSNKRGHTIDSGVIR